MKPSTLLRTFSSKLSARFSSSPSSIAPWPPVRSDFDLWLTSELDHLCIIHPSLYSTSNWLSKALQLVISAQQAARNSISSTRLASDAYLDDTTELLDACNCIKQKIQEIQTYKDSVEIVLHWLEGGAGQCAVARARTALDTCARIEKRCAELDRCGSNLQKLGERIAQQESDTGEISTGSQAVALTVVTVCSIALSFRSKRGVQVQHYPMSKGSNNCWNSIAQTQREVREEYEKRRRDGVPVLEELREVVEAAQRLRSLVSGKGNGEDLRGVVRELRSKVRELDMGVRVLEEGVDGLYRGLLDVRMCLLNVISKR